MSNSASPVEFLYGHLTTGEMKQAIAAERVVLIPIGSMESHGLHLPLDTDSTLAWNMAVETGRRIPELVLVTPTIPFTFDAHFMDYPGTIGVQSETLLSYLMDIGKSIAHHGFKRMIFVNGHGTNIPYLTIVSLRLSIETNALCTHVSSVSHLDAVNQVRKSAFPGGISHACEMETSLMLYVDPDHVQMDKAQAEMNFPRGKYFWRDMGPRAPIDVVGWWSSYSDTGTSGDPTLATIEKGQFLYNAEVGRLVEFISEFRALEWRRRRDRH